MRPGRSPARGPRSIRLMSALAELYTIPQEHLDFRDTIRQIARERIAPRAAEIDEKAEYPHDLRELLAEQDILGLPFETEHGGTGTGTLMLNMAVEEIAKACASTALILMIQELGTLPIKLFGSEELKQRFLPRCATRRVVAGVRAVRARGRLGPRRHAAPRRVRDGDEWVIDGTKNWITNLGVADFYVVFAVTDREAGHSRGITAFVVEADRPGLQRRQARAQARHPRLADRPADLRRRARARRERRSARSTGLQGRDGHARPLAPRRRRAGARHRPGRDRLRRRLRARAQAVRQADQRVPGDPVQARRHGDAVRGRAASCSTRRARRSTAATPTSASTRRWPSCSAPTWR